MKFTNLFLSVIILFVAFSCTDDEKLVSADQPVYPIVGVEKNDSTFFIENISDHYSDNIIYSNCNEILYEYNYIKEGQESFFKITGFYEWEFVPRDSIEKGVGVKRIKLSSLNPNPKYNYYPQSSIAYEYFDIKNKRRILENTGVTENYKNLLTHNPRQGFFKNLFPAPWPSIVYPLEIGKKWTWQWSYNGDTYGDPRFTSWEGIIKMDFEYHVTNKEIVEFSFGAVECYKISAKGVGGGMTNTIDYFFNPKLGFLKFIYHTNDGAEVNLYAVDYKNKCQE